MGKTFSTGLLTNGLWQDTSNNIGIGGSPSGSYKLEVTGTAKVSGAATFSSTISATVGTFTSNNGLVLNSADAAYATFQKSGTTYGFIGTAGSGTDIITGAASGDMVLRSSQKILFSTNNGASANLTITSAGNVGIGTSSPNAPLDVLGTNYDGKYTLSLLDNAALAADIGGGIYFGAKYNSTTYTGWAGILGRKDNATSGEYGGYMSFLTRTNGSAPAERMRIKSNGDVAIGTTPTANGHNFFMESGNGAYQTIGHPAGASTGYSYTLYYYNSGVIGGISQSGTTAIVYNTTSDYRLKEVISPIQNPIDTILKLKPVLFKWKNTEDEYGEGFIAHELQEVIPLAVTGEKDAVNEDGSAKLQQVDHSKLVPHLVAAIQELNDRLTKAGL